MKEPSARLPRRDAVLGAALTSLSGLAVLAHTFLGIPLAFAVPFIVLPGGLVLVGAVLLGRGQTGRLRLVSNLVIRGAKAGLLATILYDLVRPALVKLFGLDFRPFRAIEMFGELMTGLPRTHPASLTAGWTYHFWNGVSFGMMFALLRPEGGMLWGFLWAMALQLLMMLAYPAFLQVRLEDPGFLMTGLVGHGLWGLTLGAVVRRDALRT